MSDELLQTEWEQAYAAGAAAATANIRQPGRVTALLADAREQAIRDCIETVREIIAVREYNGRQVAGIADNIVNALKAMLDNVPTPN